MRFLYFFFFFFFNSSISIPCWGEYVEDGCEELVHALSVGHVRVLAAPDEEDVEHQVVGLLLLEELHLGVGAPDVLDDGLLELAVLEKFAPCACAVRGQRVVHVDVQARVGLVGVHVVLVVQRGVLGARLGDRRGPRGLVAVRDHPEEELPAEGADLGVPQVPVKRPLVRLRG
jgi:hypothetical protein